MVGEGGTGIGRGREVGWMLGERRSARPFSRVPGEAVPSIFVFRLPGEQCSWFSSPVSRAKPYSRFSSPGSRTKKKERAVAFRLPGAEAKPCSRFSFPVSRAKATQSLSPPGSRTKKECAVAFRLPDAGPRPCSRFSFPGSRVKPCGRFSRMRSAGGRLFRFRAGRACRGETIRLRMAVRLGVRGRICSRPP